MWHKRWFPVSKKSGHCLVKQNVLSFVWEELSVEFNDTASCGNVYVLYSMYRIYIYKYFLLFLYIYKHIYIYLYVYLYIYVCVYIYTYTYIYLYINWWTVLSPLVRFIINFLLFSRLLICLASVLSIQSRLSRHMSSFICQEWPVSSVFWIFFL
jgi:hypothetical protein